MTETENMRASYNGHNDLQKLLMDNSQDHILQFWDNLDEKQRQMLADINLPYLLDALRSALPPNKTTKEGTIDDGMEPVEDSCFGSVPRSEQGVLKRWWDIGLEQIALGHVAVILLAGGQGSRLGVKYPKGMYDVGLPSKKTLYQLQAERILKLQQIALEAHPSNKQCVIPWYIMTSNSTKQQTLDFFETNNFFGLNKDNVVVFEQYTLPCIGFDYKLLMLDKNELTSAPDGNGGLYKALQSRNVLADMKRRGIKCTQVYCVDNILVKMADPVFSGFCIEKNAECGAKVVEKVKPEEAVGVVCKVNGVYQVVEYSEITKETSVKTKNNGRLMFSAGNICNHYFTIEFLEKVCDPKHEEKLQYHIAKKKVANINDKNPTIPNAYKLEKFVFDVFKFAEKFAVLEVSRMDEFSPLKQADQPNKVGGNSNPRTSRYDLMHLHHRHIIKAGGNILKTNGTICEPVATNEGNYPVICEISPLVSYHGECLEQHVKGKSMISPYILK